ncbi:aminotransferase-like domain-containing protein [Rhizobium miluonense]|uniref:DNA-binding transcriptional regulator, MocR family, contains an aminotransferase domain n=1 Tax=Rhizobium miluonense TaxID=411945 RepID=A0A1C3VG13_9HYPH|nr:PLP-dependent aminotransferase family protein [Rhizobium miluonense]SCB26722.1 DNA-binding transcriptional regulator, MocR family, contains an aminotransferase domain [Rhizobium miluonense]
MKNWHPDLSRSANPRYIAIADLIEMDLRSGVLAAGDRLPPQRELAKRLNVDFTTVARGYVEAQKRGLVDSHVGRGTFVIGGAGAERRGFVSDPRRASAVDFSMNLPPDVTDPDVIARMREGMSAVAANLVSLLRYQDFGGLGMDKEAAAVWLGRRSLTPPLERIFITPGAHPTLLAIVGLLARPGDVVLSENITYAGIRSIAAQLRLNLAGLPMDEQGVLPDAFGEACERMRPKALYLNPTLQNPLTLTVPEGRRREIVAVARRYQVPIVEDDAYGFIPLRGPPPIAAIAPDITWHIGGLAKCIGAGLRLAYVVVPDTKNAWPFVSAMRTGNVMASPLNMALATRWIEDGTADGILRFVRMEAAARQEMVASILPSGSYRADPISFNIWLPLTNGWTRSTFTSHMRNAGLGVVASDAFTVEGPAPEAVRVCLGGPVGRDRLKGALDFMGHALEGPPEMAASFF